MKNHPPRPRSIPSHANPRTSMRASMTAFPGDGRAGQVALPCQAAAGQPGFGGLSVSRTTG
jgi:hypothetical protein